MKCLFVSAGMLYGGAERVTSVLVNEVPIGTKC